MRLVAFSDSHFVIKPKLIPEGDVLVVAGDIMLSGYVQEWIPIIDSIAKLPHPRKILVGGNHDRYIEERSSLALADLADRGIEYVGAPTYDLTRLLNGMSLLGLPFVTDLPRWAFNTTEDQVQKYLKDTPQVDIVVSHSPPYGIMDGVYNDSSRHYGIKAYVDYLREKPPAIWICGHCHDCYGYDKVKGVHFYNVAHCDERYNQTNPPIVLEL